MNTISSIFESIVKSFINPKDKIQDFEYVQSIVQLSSNDQTLGDFIKSINELSTKSGVIKDLKDYYLCFERISKYCIITYIISNKDIQDAQRLCPNQLVFDKIVVPSSDTIDIIDKLLETLNENISQDFNVIEINAFDYNKDFIMPNIRLWKYKFGYIKSFTEDIIYNDFCGLDVETPSDEDITILQPEVNNQIPDKFDNIDDAIKFFDNNTSKAAYQLSEWLTSLKEIKTILYQR